MFSGKMWPTNYVIVDRDAFSQEPSLHVGNTTLDIRKNES